MSRMTEDDARAYIKSRNEIWNMPEEWVEIQTTNDSFYQVDATTAETIRLALNESETGWISFADLYDTHTKIRRDTIIGFRCITRLTFAKWVAEIDVRNYQP